jgi:8-hydroxy-5-deazaflavin:NADPH oxidoreductase
MHIAILGTGNVGAALGKAWGAKGHLITYGSREPAGAKVQELLKASGAQSKATDLVQAAGAASILVLAVPFHSVQATLAGLGDLSGKILIDATNPLGPGMQLITWPGSSAAEQIAGWASGARVVKAFNMTGSGNMADTGYGPVKPAMLLCGDDPQARQSVAQLAAELGFDPVDCGPLSAARALESLAGLWVSLAYTQGQGPNIAFALLRR